MVKSSNQLPLFNYINYIKMLASLLVEIIELASQLC